MKFRWGSVALLVVVLLSLVLAACQTVQYTNRKQLMLVSQSQEAELGLQAWTTEVAPAPESTQPLWSDMVLRCGRRIAGVAERPDFQWEFKVIAENTVNAFCLPGGKVAFYEGIMPVCQDETGVAVVMGHEIGHAIARHGGERVSHNIIAQGGTTLLAAVLGGKDPENQAAVARLLGVGANVALILPFSREQESEADRIGLILMSKAGYDPRAAPGFWERMQEQGGSRQPEFLSTHPNPETRIAQLQAWMPEALVHYEAAHGKR